MTALIRLNDDQCNGELRALWAEYLTWFSAELLREFGVDWDGIGVLDRDMASIGQFRPPAGRLFLAVDGDAIAGCGGLRQIRPDVAELKRVYVRPEHRGRGIGRALVVALLAEARSIGYRDVYLDSPGFAWEAHALYHALGFREIGYYAESECPPEYAWVSSFMGLDLDQITPADTRYMSTSPQAGP